MGAGAREIRGGPFKGGMKKPAGHGAGRAGGCGVGSVWFVAGGFVEVIETPGGQGLLGAIGGADVGGFAPPGDAKVDLAGCHLIRWQGGAPGSGWCGCGHGWLW
jgi:hypothetical protein